MRVLSANIGKKREINYHGKIVETGIFKEPVEEEIVLEKEDVLGDDVIDRRYHGGVDKACYLFSELHYGYWQEIYPDLDWKYGMFGENVTLSEMNEADIYIGDIYTLGTALVQVTQPRQPCFKLNARFKSDSLVKEFIKHGFSGVYLRVLKEGTVRKGDEMILKERLQSQFSIFDIFHLLYHKESNRENIDLAIQIESLAASCRKDLSK
jgi:MOSC domain-containing protein YiiM